VPEQVLTEERADPRIERTRTAVIDIAVELLLEGGVYALTIEAIVQRSGVARSTIYRHWPSRNEVVADALRALIPEIPTPPVTGDLEFRLNTLLRAVVNQFADARYAAVVPAILDSAARDPELAEIRERFEDTQSAPLRRVLTDAVDAGELSPDTDVLEAAAQLVGPLFFRGIVQNLEVTPESAARSIKLFLASRR
jgi:AcrR family transcriptional regulator